MANINLFDRVLKILGRHYAGAFLRLVFPNQQLQLVGTQENVELSLPDRRIDFLHQLKAGDEEYLLHFEFQLQHDANLPRRMFIYSAELTDQFQKAVISAVLYLERRESEILNEYVVQIGESVIHRFNYLVLKLWDYEEEIRSGQLREFAPLLVMLAQEKTEADLHREKALILQESNPRKRADLLATAVMIASRYFESGYGNFSKRRWNTCVSQVLLPIGLRKPRQKPVSGDSSKGNSRSLSNNLRQNLASYPNL